MRRLRKMDPWWKSCLSIEHENGGQGPPFSFSRLLETEPDSVAPISPAIMFAPAIVAIPVAPAPIVVMNNDAEMRTIAITFAGVPAIARPIAHDIRRSRGGCAGKSRNADDGCRRTLQHQFFHSLLSASEGVYAASTKKTPDTRAMFQGHFVAGAAVDGVMELK